SLSLQSGKKICSCILPGANRSGQPGRVTLGNNQYTHRSGSCQPRFSEEPIRPPAPDGPDECVVQKSDAQYTGFQSRMQAQALRRVLATLRSLPNDPDGAQFPGLEEVILCGHRLAERGLLPFDADPSLRDLSPRV